MRSITELLKAAVSWAVAVLTVSASTLWLAYIGQATVMSFDAGWAKWLPVLRYVLMGVLPIVASIVALRRRKPAALLLLIPLACFLLWWSIYLPTNIIRVEGYGDQIPSAISFSPLLTFLIPGLFWLVTSWLSWPRTLSSSISARRQAAIGALILVSVLIGSATIALFTIDFPQSHGATEPFASQLSPRHSVFTAHVIRTGRLWPREWPGPPYPTKQWALAVVGRHFWGLPFWNRKIVVLTGVVHSDYLQRGASYFVDGRRLSGPLTRYMPIYDLASRTTLLKDAEIDMRVLHDGMPAKGTRLLGRTVRIEDRGLVMVQRVPVPRVKIEIYSHSTGLFEVMSDSGAVFDVSGLPDEIYDVRAAGNLWHYSCCNTRRSQTEQGHVCDCEVSVH